MARREYGISPLMQVVASHLERPVTGDVRWLYAGARDLDGLTDGDRALVRAVTGENIPHTLTGLGQRVSFFVLHLAADRTLGVLRDGRPVTVEYLEEAYTAYEECSPAGNAVSGELLDRALAYLVGCEQPHETGRAGDGPLRADTSAGW